MHLIVAFALLATNFMADESDHPALKRWEDSKNTYQKTTEEHRKTVVKLLQSVEDRARAAGDVDKVRSVKEEREAFQASGKSPKSIKTEIFERDMEAARAVLRREATVAKAALLKSQLDAAADKVHSQLNAILNVPDVPDAPSEGRWKASYGNIWSHKAANEWVETTPEGKQKKWLEFDRTSERIELRTPDRKGWIRLYRSHADVHYGDGNFSRWGEGTWEGDPPAYKTPVGALLPPENIQVVVIGDGNARKISVDVKCDQAINKKLLFTVVGEDGYKRNFGPKSTSWKEGISKSVFSVPLGTEGDTLTIRISTEDKPLKVYKL